MTEVNGLAVVEEVKEGRSLLAPLTANLLAELEQAQDPDTLQERKALYAALAVYLEQQHRGPVEEVNAAMKLRVRAEHRLGEILAVTVNHAGSRGVGNSVLST